MVTLIHLPRTSLHLFSPSLSSPPFFLIIAPSSHPPPPLTPLLSSSFLSFLRLSPRRLTKESEPTVLDTLAVWYLNIIASTAKAAMPIAPHLRSTILAQSKYVIYEHQSLSTLYLFHIQCKKVVY